MRLRNTLILIVVLALLGAYVYFFERGEPAGEATPTPSSVAVLDLEAGDVTGLAVEGPEGSTRLSRPVDGDWQMEEPAEEPADDVRVDALVSTLSQLSASRVLTGTTDLEPFGLASPSWRVEIGLSDGTEKRLRIGDMNPAGSQYYVQEEGEQAIYLVYASTIEGLQRLVNEPPYQPTPTPTATPAPETPTPTPAESESGS